MKPNFFILGAPKCGTTSLAHWLSQHPNVFFSQEKEPHYYSTDFPISTPRTQQMYFDLFAGVTEQHLAIGEGSVWYLRSEDAVANIQKEIPEAKYIVMLRNPVEMAPSLHWQSVFNGDEDVQDFETAWALQEVRRQGRDLPSRCRAAILLQYADACKLGEQLQRLYAEIGRERVHVVFLEDLQKRQQDTWQKVLDFLKLPEVEGLDFSVQNPAKRWRRPWVQRFGHYYYRAQRKFGFAPLGLGIYGRLSTGAIEEASRPDVAASAVEMLRLQFADDISLLGRLTQRDLSDWTSE